MSNWYDDKVVVITGAGSGLGQATALQLAKEGANLSLVDIKWKRFKRDEWLSFRGCPRLRDTFSYS